MSDTDERARAALAQGGDTFDALTALNVSVEAAAKALTIMADLVEKTSAENAKLRKIVAECAPHRLKEVTSD